MVGAQHGCPFCKGRVATPFQIGELIAILSGHGAGTVAEVTLPELQHGFEFEAQPLGKKSAWRIRRDYQLLGRLADCEPVDWLPPFDLRNSQIIDAAAVWFCDELASRQKGDWEQGALLAVAWCCWRKRVNVTPQELSKVMMHHGMPPKLAGRFEAQFDLARNAMWFAAQRAPLKNSRKPNLLIEQFGEMQTAVSTPISQG